MRAGRFEAASREEKTDSAASTAPSAWSAMRQPRFAVPFANAWTSEATSHESVTPLVVPVEVEAVADPATDGWPFQVTLSSHALVTPRAS